MMAAAGPSLTGGGSAAVLSGRTDNEKGCKVNTGTSELVRMSIATALEHGGIAGRESWGNDPTGALRVTIAGRVLTPGEAADRYLTRDEVSGGWLPRAGRLLLLAETRDTYAIDGCEYQTRSWSDAVDRVRAWSAEHPAETHAVDAWFTFGHDLTVSPVTVRLNREGAVR